MEGAINDHDPDELYRRAKLAQRMAEQAGLTITASAWAIVAESVLLGADVDATAILHLAGEWTGPPNVLSSNVLPLFPETRR